MLGGLNNLYRMSLLLTADIRGFTTGLARAEGRLLRFSGTINKFGQSLNRGVGLALGIVGAAAVQTAADFDRANAILGKIVGETNLAPLTAQAKRLGRETVFLAREAAQAQLELAKLGFRADEINAVLDKSTQLATVFGTDLDKTGKTIASTLRQFGLGLRGAEGLENVARVTDVMSEAFRSSALDLDKLREGLKNVGPTARSTNLSFEKTVALLAVLANNAVDGSLGGTKLRSTLSDLAKQFPDVNEGLDSLGDQTLTYADLLDILNKRAALVGAIFNKNQVEIEGFEKALLEAAGATDELSEGIENQFFFQLDKLKNAFQAVGTEIGFALAPTVESLADSFSTFAESLEKTDDKKLERIVQTLTGLVGLGLAAQTLGFLGITMGRISKLSGAFSKALVRSGTASASMARGLGPAAVAVTSLAQAMGSLIDLTLGGEVFGISFVSNKNLQQEARAAERLATATAAAKTQEEARNRLAAERTRPSQTFDDLLQFTEVDSIEAARKEIEFFQDKLTTAEAKLKSFADAGLTTGDSVKNLQEFIADTNLEIGALERLILLLQEKEKLEKKTNDAKKLREFNEEYKKQADELQRAVELTEQLRREQLRLVQSTEVPSVFGQNFMFDELTAAEQLVALLSGKGIKTAQEFANQIESFEPNEDLFEDFTEEVDESTKAIDKLADRLILIREGLVVARKVAFEFADSLGQAFIQSRQESVKFFDAFADSFKRAFNAVIGKLITLIALYTILAVVSGGASLAAGGSFGTGFNAFTEANKFGDFLGEGFGIGTRASASGAAILGERGGVAQVRLSGTLSGDTIVIANQRGTRAMDRTFG